MLTACGTTSISGKTKVCPKPLIPTIEERSVLRTQIPQFYIKFTNQQLDLTECYLPSKSTTLVAVSNVRLQTFEERTVMMLHDKLAGY